MDREGTTWLLMQRPIRCDSCALLSTIASITPARSWSPRHRQPVRQVERGRSAEDWIRVAIPSLIEERAAARRDRADHGDGRVAGRRAEGRRAARIGLRAEPNHG